MLAGKSGVALNLAVFQLFTETVKTGEGRGSGEGVPKFLTILVSHFYRGFISGVYLGLIFSSLILKLYQNSELVRTFAREEKKVLISK